MNIQLIHGSFSAREALEIITQMIHIKIKFHENKIRLDSSEEDIKRRETKIKRLQKDLYTIRDFIENGVGKVSIESEIHLSR